MVWTPPVTFSAGLVSVAAMNAIQANLNAVGDAYTAYIPAWSAATTAPVLNNGTLAGGYNLTGKTCDFYIRLAIGSSTTMGSGVYSFTLPFTAFLGIMPVGEAIFRSGAATWYTRTAMTVTAGTSVNLTSDAGSRVTHNSPAVPSNGDLITIVGRYQTT